MAAAILTSETIILHNLPYVRDIITMRRLLEDIGAHVLTPELRTHKISAANVELLEAPYELVKTMRASVLALGPLLARFGKAKVSLPGGCAIGARPIDLHLTGFEKLGAEVILESGDVVARAITNGELEIKDCNPEHCNRIIAKLREVGVEVEEINQSTLQVRRSARGLKASDLTTAPYPDFPTDMQAQYMTLMTQAEGRSVITETVFENRFMHASELQRMSARIQIGHDQATVDGPATLTGARVQASDLRASASLVLAGLVADGETTIDRVYHIDRGYERIEAKLKTVGADIERVRESVTARLPSHEEGSVV